MIKSVNDLEVYTQSLNLLEKIYIIFKKVPKTEFDISNNCKRAAKSIPSNLAEGFAKRSSAATFKNHLKICIGSSDEVVSHLRALSITTPYLKGSFIVLMEKYTVLSKRLNSLQKNWRYNTSWSVKLCVLSEPVFQCWQSDLLVNWVYWVYWFCWFSRLSKGED